MLLSDSAAQVMSLSESGGADAALLVAHQALSDAPDADPLEQAALWYAIAVAHHAKSEFPAQVDAAGHCLRLARVAGSPGWASNALSIRAMAMVRQETIEPALVDLARAEVELQACTDPALISWAHTGLGYCYLELRLYELALPHFEAAPTIDASPMPFREFRVVDLMNLAELHLRWADELERATPYEGAETEAEQRRAQAHRTALEAVAEAERVGATALGEACRATALCSLPRDDAATTVAELEAAFASHEHNDQHGGRSAVGGALARVLWRQGRHDEALDIARQAADLSARAGDWQVGASARWLLVELEAAAGIPGAGSGREYARLLSRVLWRQRLSTLAGAQAALDVERLRHDALVAQRAARQDPLTGLGNRRALDDALTQAMHDATDDGVPTTLLVIDLDAFKAINDRYGHLVGDAVLCEAAGVIKTAARTEDTVARLGGDEFVVLARGTDEEAGIRLAERVAAAFAELEVSLPDGPLRLGASVGVRTTGSGLELADLLGAADEAMYDVKRTVRTFTPGLVPEGDGVRLRLPPG